MCTDTLTHTHSHSYTHTLIHPYTHTPHTLILPYTHTLIHPYTHTPHTLILPYTHTPIHPYTHTLIHSYTHTPIHSYSHTPIHSYSPRERSSEGQELCKISCSCFRRNTERLSTPPLAQCPYWPVGGRERGRGKNSSHALANNCQQLSIVYIPTS